MPTILTPERISFLLMFVSFALFITARRNSRAYYISWLTAALYACLEILAQAALLGIVLYLLLLVITSFFPTRFGGFMSLILSALIVIRPARLVTTNIEAYLAGTYGQKEEKT